MADESQVSKKNKSTIFLALIVVIVVLFFILKDSYTEIRDFLQPQPEVKETEPANVNLYKFNGLSGKNSTSVEIWLINLGDETAKNISVFVRARNQNGLVLFVGNISLTSLVLHSNETCSGIYLLSYTNSTKKIYNTIELKWDGGREGYQKEIII